jgi:hypothetical protein
MRMRNAIILPAYRPGGDERSAYECAVRCAIRYNNTSHAAIQYYSVLAWFLDRFFGVRGQCMIRKSARFPPGPFFLLGIPKLDAGDMAPAWLVNTLLEQKSGRGGNATTILWLRHK